MSNEKTFLITGGAGFIGSHLCKKLIKLGYKVICFDNLSTGSLDNISELQKNSNFIFVKGDANKLEDIEPVFEKNKIDGVFHYAALVGVKRTLENPLGVLKDIDGIKNVLELALKHNKPKIIFASSSEVYGEPKELPEREDGPMNPKMPYAVVKLAGEKFLEAYYEKYGLKTCALRFFNVYGPNQQSSDYGFVVGIFISQVLAGNSPTVFGDGSPTRDFTYIDDNIEASLRAMLSERTNGEVINIGSGRPLTIYNLANNVIEAAGLKGKINLKLEESDRIDIRHRFPEVGKMIKLLDFRPEILLEEGLRRTIESYKK
jgi:UDP-glucose 4-epimerase